MERGLPVDVMDALRLAPFEPSEWAVALQGAAAWCGASSAQILAYGSAGLPMLMAPGFTKDDIAAYLALGGGDPRVNRGMAFMTAATAAPLRPYADYEYMTEADRRRDPLYNEFFGPRDGAHMSVGVMVRKPSLTANLSFMRTEPMEQADRQATAQLLAVFARACDLQYGLEGRAAAVMAQTMDALAEPMLFCDADGVLVSATRTGEAILSEGSALIVRHGRVSCAAPASDQSLRRLVAECGKSGDRAGLGGSFVMHDRDGRPARIDVAPLPSDRGAAAFRPLAMIRIHEMQPLPRLDLSHAISAFNLTRAEAQVAAAVISGLSSPEIAQQRDVSVLTVASQVRAIISKTGCKRRAELPALFAPFMIR